ncbi:MAG: Flp pilus assembly complex ATPase component TadA, partial [Candidatus Aenigmarchaeota archaeon]|nr:Flp pilus assembly complex ATPase component TadA [Candidatus Aenigmarchaeota archaeon]
MRLRIKKRAIAGGLPPAGIRPLNFKIDPKLLGDKFKRGYVLLMEKRRRAVQEQMKGLALTPQEQMFYQQFFLGAMGGGGFPGYPGGPGTGAEQKPAEAEKTVRVEVQLEGFSLPTGALYEGKIGFLPEQKVQLVGFNVSYPLIPKQPRRGERVFAMANIRWDPASGEVIYNVIEPPLSAEDKQITEKIKKELEERLDIDFIKLGPVKAKNMLVDEIAASLVKYKDITPERQTLINYYIQRDVVGYGKLEAIMNDPNIEDISCDGIRIPLYVYHRDPKLGSLRTNIYFDTAEELNLFVARMAQKCKKTISIAEPLLDATLPDGSRMQATLGTDIARKGSNFTVRKFTELPLTPTHMLKYGTLDSMQMAYLWMAIENGMSVLVSGGTATGKTSLMNALSLFIRPNLKIVSIEDTAELRLPHPHWIPHVARTVLGTGGKKGEVTLFDLLKSSLRQRPDYIIVGEVRGKEAFVLFQQMASIPGEEKVMVLKGNRLERMPIGSVQNPKGCRIPTIDPDTLKIRMADLKMNVEHPATNELYKITTKTGREIIAKGSHSLFTLSGGNIEPVIISESKPGDKILIPARLPCGYNNADYLDLTELMPDIRVYSPSYVRQASRKLGFEKASKIAGFTTISNYYGVNNCALPADRFKRLMKEAGIDYETGGIMVRFERGKSPLMPARLKLSPELLRFLGYHISEGTINTARKNNSMAVYNKNKEVLSDMRRCIKSITGKMPKEREVKGYGTATELRFNNKTLFE